MLTDARTLRSGSALEADVCIVGGGAAGISMAMELLNSGLRVLLIESGGTEPDAATQALMTGDSIGAPATTLDNPVTLDQTRLRYLGGTTNHWAGYCRPLSPVDFESRDHLGISGWPIDYVDLVPYWDRATEWVRSTSSRQRAEPRHRQRTIRHPFGCRHLERCFLQGRGASLCVGYWRDRERAAVVGFN